MNKKDFCTLPVQPITEFIPIKDNAAPTIRTYVRTHVRIEILKQSRRKYASIEIRAMKADGSITGGIGLPNFLPMARVDRRVMREQLDSEISDLNSATWKGIRKFCLSENLELDEKYHLQDEQSEQEGDDDND